MTHARKSLRILGIFLPAAAIAFCRSSPTDPVAQDSLTIVSIQPPAGTPGTVLPQGASVTFSATIAYSLASAPSGSVAMVFQDETFKAIPGTVPQPVVSVARGTGTVVLTQNVVIPAANVANVNVFFLLAATGGTQSLAAQEVTYRVGPAS